ncbi:hypothetical protein Tco_0270064 [Tanacetum coccineum]
MDNPNITMEEYIRLEEEKARRRGKVFNWETATYENDNDKVNMPLLPSPEHTVSYFDVLDFFKDFENEFPAIIYNDAQTSKSDLSTEPILNPQHIDEFNLKDETSVSEFDEEKQNVLNFNDLFPFNVIYPNDSKSDKDSNNDKVDIKHTLGDLFVKLLPDLMNTDVGAYAHGSNKLLETILIFNIFDTAYSLNEYSVFDTRFNTAYPGDLVKEISMNVGEGFTNLEILKCWSLETLRRLFNMKYCS